MTLDDVLAADSWARSRARELTGPGQSRLSRRRRREGDTAG